MNQNLLPSLQPMDALYNPRSVALMGVSSRVGSYGSDLMNMCAGGGFTGKIFPINPNLDTILGHRVYGAISDLPEVPDHVVISLAASRVIPAAQQALAAGVKALTVYANFPERSLRAQLSNIVAEAGAVLCGPNCMGLHNITAGLRLSPFQSPLDLKPGGVGLIAQSGSVFGALFHNERRIRYSQVVSTGSEFVTTAADHLMWIVKQPETCCVGLFLEAVRDPDKFVEALEAAAARDIPIVILKVGKSEASARMAISHTGAMVGNSDIFRAIVTRLGAHLADDMDQMAAMLSLFSQGRRATTNKIASIHDSGGERELMTDLAEDLKLEYATVSQATLDKISVLLEPGLHPENPLDAWGTGKGAEKTFSESTKAMLADPSVGLVLYSLNWNDRYPLHLNVHRAALSTAAQCIDKPLAAVSNFSGSQDDEHAEYFIDKGVPVIRGMQNALAAAKALVSHGQVKEFRKTHAKHARAGYWRERLSERAWIGEAEGYALFSEYGIAVPRHGVAESRDEAQQIAAQIGQPIIMKTALEGVAHKTDVCGIQAGLLSEQDVAVAYDTMSTDLGAQVLIAEMLPTGAEWALGVIDDPDFGPAIRIAVGGTFVELLPEQALLMAPFTREEAKEAILGLAASRTLEGYRGGKPLSVDSLAQCASVLSRLAWDMQGVLAEIEINPVFVTSDNAIAADAVLRAKQYKLEKAGRTADAV